MKKYPELEMEHISKQRVLEILVECGIASIEEGKGMDITGSFRQAWQMILDDGHIIAAHPQAKER